MSSIRWNDMNDSSQMSQASSDDGPPRKNEDKNANPTTTLQKTVSTPEPVLRPKFDPNEKIAENLEKLSKHTDSKVWLYITNTFNNQEAEAEKILNSVADFERVLPLSKGFNVCLKTDAAAKYIEKGYSEKGINFKMIYSTKNQHGQARQVQKKYSEKQRHYDTQQVKSPRFKTKKTFVQKNNYPKDDDREKVDKKKVKYVAKESIQKKEEPSKVIQEVQEKSEPSITKTISKNSDNSDSRTGEQKQKVVEKAANQQKVKQEKNQKAAKKEEEVEPKMTKKESEYSDQEKQEVRGKKKNTKNKRKGKAGGGGNTKSVFDPNNPFSSLM